MFVSHRKLLLIVLVLIEIENSNGGNFVIKENIKKLTTALQELNTKLNNSYNSYTEKCPVPFNDIIFDSIQNNENSEVDKIIDEYLREVEDWKMFEKFDQVQKLNELDQFRMNIV